PGTRRLTTPAPAGRPVTQASMYLDPFKLKELPFRLSPDPQFLYLSKQHARAKAYMESTIWFTDGFVVITGEIGSGKTTLIESFLKEIPADVVVAQINQTQVSAIDFLQPVLNEKLDAPELVQLTQRIRLRFHLGNLSQGDMHGYIQHRLEVAGAGDRQLFAEEVFAEIFRYTGGVPRLVNTLCDTAMMAA